MVYVAGKLGFIAAVIYGTIGTDFRIEHAAKVIVYNAVIDTAGAILLTIQGVGAASHQVVLNQNVSI